MSAMNNPDELAKKIIWVYENEMLIDRIISRGIDTAAKYTWDNIIPQLIKYYRQISRFKPIKSQEQHKYP